MCPDPAGWRPRQDISGPDLTILTAFSHPPWSQWARIVIWVSTVLTGTHTVATSGYTGSPESLRIRHKDQIRIREPLEIQFATTGNVIGISSTPSEPLFLK